MDEVDDILDQNRAAQNDVDDEEEDEDDDEVDVTLLRNNIDKDGEENNDDHDDESQDDGQDGDGDEDAEDDEMEQDDDDADEDDDEDDDMEGDEGDSDDEDDDEDMDQDREKNDEGKLQRNGVRDVEQADSTNLGEATNGNASNSDGDKSEDESDEYDDQKEDSTAASREQDVLESVHNYYTQMLSSAKIASTYNIYPTAAIPIQTNVNTITLSKGLQYLFLGGSDGYIRKYDFLNTMDGKLSLTILQKHSLAESIQNAGILVSYWENEIPQKRSEMKMSKNNKEYEPKVSPVYSIEVQNECLFLLSGLENGGITLQGVRYMEGAVGHYFKGKEGHTNIVNHLKLNGDETRFMSASWDKRILEWDLQTGGITNEFKGSTSEVSSMEMRPLYSTVDISQVASEMKNNDEPEESHNSDDDMGSLFGDDEEENNGEDSKLPESKTEKLDTSSMEEISRSTLNVVYDESTFLTSGLNGSVYIWDRRIPTGPALSLERGPKVPPWCQSACWCMDGDRVFAGRRNAIVEEFDLKMPSHPSNTLKLPAISGPVTCVRAMPNNKQVLCASRDNIRLYNTGSMPNTKGTAVPFLIVPGHHGGAISNMYVDPTCRFLVSTSGSRGWQGNSTDTTFIYEIDLE